MRDARGSSEGRMRVEGEAMEGRRAASDGRERPGRLRRNGKDGEIGGSVGG